MGALSYANAISLVKAAVNLLEKTERYAHTTSPNYDGLYDTLIAANVGDYASDSYRGAIAHRAALSAMLAPAVVRDVINGPLNELAVAISAPERNDPAAIMQRWYDYSIALGTDDTFNARGFTRGTPAAGGSNVGNGNLRRLTVDENDYPLECSHTEVKTFECMFDQNTVDKHQEVFEVRGAPSEPDMLYVAGSGILLPRGLTALTTRDSEAILVNPTFSQFSGTAPTAGSESTPAATTSITGWTLTSAANARVSIDFAYRDLIGESKTYSMRFTDNNKAVQSIQTNRRARLNTREPYYVQMAIYRASACDGNIIMRWGSYTLTTAMSTLSNGAWNIIKIALDKNTYYKNVKKDTMTFEVELASRTTGSAYIDDIIIAPFTRIDGTYWALIGGTTNYLKGDTYTVTDTENASRGVLQYWLGWRSGIGISFPANNAGGETISDPA